jgi:ABC-type polysaccharide/polyol phosphate transport system ATPase subunit
MSGPNNHLLELNGVSMLRRRWSKRPDSFKTAVINRLKGIHAPYEEFWPLRDVSFSLGRGEFMGVCGANGAGKSTLLKIIARVLPPTTGSVTVCGRLTSLLQLGAGFLPHLPGWENIILNGVLLGLSEAEIRRRMDAIIEFADLGDFIYSPVSAYSAGMYMRLGFAIASHVGAEILLIDEILAVGDAEFKAKCLAWLRESKRQGTAALIVSHNLPLLTQLCERVAWLDQGRVRSFGPSADVVRAYEASVRPAH